MSGDRMEYFGELFVDFGQVPLASLTNQLVQVINELDVVSGFMLVHCSGETDLMPVENLR